MEFHKLMNSDTWPMFFVVDVTINSWERSKFHLFREISILPPENEHISASQIFGVFELQWKNCTILKALTSYVLKI